MLQLLHSQKWLKSLPWEGKMKLALVFLRVQKGTNFGTSDNL